MGYGRSAATQTQYNWARQTASHNVVVVNEASQLETGETGGSLELFAESPLVRVVEASSNRCYAKQGVSVYRRLAALVGGDDAAPIFWISSACAAAGSMIMFSTL